MGRTALYRDPAVFKPARADVQVDVDTLHVAMPDGRTHHHALHGCSPSAVDGFVTQRLGIPVRSSRHGPPVNKPHLRRFVRMLVIGDRLVLITPPDQGAVAPNVVRVPEAPTDSAIVDENVWDAVSDWLLGGGRLGACSVADLARLARIATPQFAVLIGEVAAQRALELVVGAGPLRGGLDVDTGLAPLASAARTSTRAHEAFVAALAFAVASRRRRYG